MSGLHAFDASNKLELLNVVSKGPFDSTPLKILHKDALELLQEMLTRNTLLLKRISIEEVQLRYETLYLTMKKSMSEEPLREDITPKVGPSFFPQPVIEIKTAPMPPFSIPLSQTIPSIPVLQIKTDLITIHNSLLFFRNLALFFGFLADQFAVAVKSEALPFNKSLQISLSGIFLEGFEIARNLLNILINNPETHPA